MIVLSCPSLTFADEVPLGGRYDRVAETFNAVAQRANSKLRMVKTGCPHTTLCEYKIGDAVPGNGRAVSANDPTLETMLFVHGCSKEDAALLAGAASFFVTIFGRHRRPTHGSAFAELQAALASKNLSRQVLTVDGVEFTNSSISCTLLIAKPQEVQ